MLQICNLSRRTLGQTGDGHFSPVGGFNEPANQVLLLDTARFKYPPHWVDLNMLYDSMDTLDTETDSKRGFIILSRKVCALEKSIDALDYIRFPMLPSVDINKAF